VHTACARQLGQMLVKLCVQQDIPLVAIVRRDEHVELLKGLGAKFVLNSKSETFDKDLAQAIADTNATIGFDATGGGTLVPQILSAMETGAKIAGAEASWYGTDVLKQIYVYGLLDRTPLTFTPSWISAGFNWSVGGFLLHNVLKRVGPKRTMELYGQVAAGLTTTFKTSYSAEVSLEEMIEPDTLRAYAAQRTGEKYLVNPNKV
jgi:NADPH:quinone reductase